MRHLRIPGVIPGQNIKNLSAFQNQVKTFLLKNQHVNLTLDCKLNVIINKTAQKLTCY